MPYLTRDDGTRIYWEEAGSPAAFAPLALRRASPKLARVTGERRREGRRDATGNPERARDEKGVDHGGADVAQAFRPADGKPPLLLIMGLGATLEWWQRLGSVLSPNYCTIAFDKPGGRPRERPPG